MTDIREALTEALLGYCPLQGPTFPLIHGEADEVAESMVAALPPGSWLAGPAERAVIEAAKAYRTAWLAYMDDDEAWKGVPPAHDTFDAAVDALMEADRG